LSVAALFVCLFVFRVVVVFLVRGQRSLTPRPPPSPPTKKNTQPTKGIISDLAKSRTALKKDQQEELDCARKVRAWCCGEPEGGAASDGGAAGDGEKGTPAGGRDVRLGDWTAREIEVLNGWQLLTAKPVVYLVNVSEKDYARKKNKFLPKIFEWVQVREGAAVKARPRAPSRRGSGGD